MLPPRQLRRCKSGVSDVVIGAAALMADYSGYGKAGHIKEKLNEMIHKEETLYACSLACSCEGKCTPSGAYLRRPLLANVGKHNVTQLIYEIDRLAQDIGGGIIATMPSESDLKSPEVGHYVEKYLHGVEGVSTGEPHARGTSYREHDRRHRAGGVHARCRFSPGPEGHVLQTVLSGEQEAVRRPHRRCGE